ncbi:MAG: MerR family transcriptional regulator [bacterium]
MQEQTYYTIGEVSRETSIAPQTIRYWESRFRLLRPSRLAGGHRRYARRDINTILEIKDLIFRRGFTLSGARKTLFSASRRTGKSGLKAADHGMEILGEIKKELLAIVKEC